MEGYRRPMRKLLSREPGPASVAQDRRSCACNRDGPGPFAFPGLVSPAVTKPHLAHAADFDGMHSIQRAMQVIGQPCTSGKGGTVHISARTPTHPNGAAPMFAPGSAR